MDPFYFSTITIAMVLFILSMIVLWYIMKNNSISDEIFPPSKNTCPDNWIADGSYCSIPPLKFNQPLSCVNCGNNHFAANNANHKYYKTIKGMNIYEYNDTNQFRFISTPCQLKKWADTNNIKWDGITNHNNC